MKSALRGLIAIMLVIFMVFALAACKDKKSQGGSNGGNEDPAPGINLNPGSPEDEEDEIPNFGNPEDEEGDGGNSETGDNDVNIGDAFG